MNWIILEDIGASVLAAVVFVFIIYVSVYVKSRKEKKDQRIKNMPKYWVSTIHKNLLAKPTLIYIPGNMLKNSMMKSNKSWKQASLFLIENGMFPT